MKTIQARQSSVIPLGRLGENECTRIEFDVSEWAEEYPEAYISLFYQRPSDITSYPISSQNIEAVGNVIYWTITSTELSDVGGGCCELVAVVDNVVAKSAIYRTHVAQAIDQNGEAPDPWDSWQEEFVELEASTRGYAESAAEAASHYPIIQDGYWYTWSTVLNKFVNTNTKAKFDGKLNDITDVTITNPKNHQVLGYSGGIWFNMNTSLGGLSDTEIGATPQSGQILTWSNGKWRNMNPTYPIMPISASFVTFSMAVDENGDTQHQGSTVLQHKINGSFSFLFGTVDTILNYFKRTFSTGYAISFIIGNIEYSSTNLTIKYDNDTSKWVLTVGNGDYTFKADPGDYFVLQE